MSAPFANVLAAAPADQPDWAARRRTLAREAFETLGLPTRRDEEWKYTNTRELAKPQWRLGALPADLDGVRAQLAALPVPASMPRVVWVNGMLAHELSTLDALPAGVTVTSVDEAVRSDDGTLEAWFDVRGEFSNGLEALAALAPSGVVLRVAADADVPPIAIVHVAAPGGAPAVHGTSLFVEVGRHARAELAEVYVGPDGSTWMTSAETHVRLAAGAELRHAKLQLEGSDAFHVAHGHAEVARDATYRAFQYSGGARLARDTTQVSLDGEGGHAELLALYYANAGRHVDHHTALDHRVPHCTSEQQYKGILDGDGHGVFNGKVFVRPQAQKTSAQQLNNNLLLSREARVDAKPQLEIFADDVKCTHGATVGQLDPASLFYLASRGIDPDVARRLLIQGFAEDVLARVPIDGLREGLVRDFQQRMVH